MDLIPVRIGDVGYVYDKISCRIFGNAGTGSITTGPDIEDKNRPYDAEIEYIENIGGSYIDTEIKGSGEQRVECVFMPIKKDTGWNCVYGARTTAGSKDDGIYIYSNNTSNNVGYVAYNTTSQNNLAAAHASLNVKHTIIQNKGLFTLDGATIKSFTNATFTCPTATIFIFDASNNGTRGNYKGYFRLYSFKLYDANGVLVRNMIPVRIGNVGLLYDKVSTKLFKNKGTDNFVLGPDKKKYYNMYDSKIEYLEGTGTQKINTGITYNFTGKIKIIATASPINTDRCIIIGNYKASASTISCEFGGTANNHAQQPRFYMSLTSASSTNDTW